ncbi:RNA-binding protein with serine-rich domain 1 family protein [Cooperia oncophora]
MVEKKEEEKRRKSRSASSSSSSSSGSSSSSESSGSSRSSSSSSSSRSPSPRNRREAGKATTVRARSRSPRRSPARARAERGAGDRPSRRSPSPRRRRVSTSPKRRDRSSSRGRRRSPRRSSPRRASPRRSPKRSPRRASPRKASPSRRISVRNLSRNVTKEHLAEIFGMYGQIKSCDLPPERFYSHLHRGYGYVEYENAEDAEKALKYFDGGQIDGQVVSVELTLNRAASRRSPARKSPARRRYSGTKAFTCRPRSWRWKCKYDSSWIKPFQSQSFALAAQKAQQIVIRTASMMHFEVFYREDPSRRCYFSYGPHIRLCFVIFQDLRYAFVTQFICWSGNK